MNEASLAIARKVVLCAGLLVAALLFLYPHWRVKFTVNDSGNDSFDFNYGLGRSFIDAPPTLTPYQFAELGGFKDTPRSSSMAFEAVKLSGKIYAIDYRRQSVEVLLALLFTFGVMWALGLMKPAVGRKHNAEE